MLNKRKAVLRAGIIAPALFLFAISPVAAQDRKEMTPELQKVREALDRYKDPIAAVHDGYFSTVGCVEYPKSGGHGQVPYPAGGMGVHIFNVGLIGKARPPEAAGTGLSTGREQAAARRSRVVRAAVFRGQGAATVVRSFV